MVDGSPQRINPEIFKLDGAPSQREGRETLGKDNVLGERESYMPVLENNKKLIIFCFPTDLAAYRHSQQVKQQQWL